MNGARNPKDKSRPRRGHFGDVCVMDFRVLWVGGGVAAFPDLSVGYFFFFIITDRVYILYKIQYRIVSPLWPCFSFPRTVPAYIYYYIIGTVQNPGKPILDDNGSRKKTVPSGCRYPRQRSKHARVVKTVCAFDIFYASKWYTHYTLSGTYTVK